MFLNYLRAMGVTARHILAVDETSKDGRAFRRCAPSAGSITGGLSCERFFALRSFGYSMRGYPAVGTSGLLPRGERISSLCSIDVDGFVARRHTDNTFNRDGFLLAAQSVVVCACGHRRPKACPVNPLPLPQYDQVQPWPGPNSVVVIDNAAIHRCFEFVRQVNLRGGVVVFTPPYCWNLNPLDNGAFGKVKRWLQQHGEFYASMGLTTSEVLDRRLQPVAGWCAHSKRSPTLISQLWLLVSSNFLLHV
jgi:hypothetical protein